MKTIKTQNTMKRFNQTISIEIEVDAIAQQLRGMFKEDSPYADTVVEQIIGRASSKDTILLSRIMSAMNGFRKEIIAEIGNTYHTKDYKVYGYWTEESKEHNNTVYGYVEQVKVIDINEYADNQLHVEYQIPNKKGELETRNSWISASYLNI